MRRPRFDWHASMNTMLGLRAEPLTGEWRTSLVVGYHAAMQVPVCDLDELQLGRFWGQGPSDDMLAVLIPTTIRHLERDLLALHGRAMFGYLTRLDGRQWPELAALSALIEGWAPRLVEILRDPGRPLQREVAELVLYTAERHPAALLAFETAYRAAGDLEGVARMLAARAKASAGEARVALLVERAQTCEQALDLAEAEYAWIDLVIDLPDRAHEEAMRLCALDPDPPWGYFVIKLREAAAALPARRDELRRRAADLAATKLDDPALVAEILRG